MIQYQLAGLLGAPVGTSREITFTVDPADAAVAGVSLAHPLTGDLRLQRTNRGIWMEGQAEAAIIRSCVRCLDTFDDAIQLDLAEEFLPSVDLGSGATISHAETEDEVRRIDAHHEIDLWPVLFEELTLAEPAHPLCRAECRGLCPICGRHRDRDPCDCRETDMDPRLAALADWQPPAADEAPD